MIKQLRHKWEAELKSLANQRMEIDQKMLGLQTMIKGLGYMEKEPAKSDPTNFKLEPIPLPPDMKNLHSLGMTDAVRLILANASTALTPRQVRDRLEAFGYEKLPKDNPMAAVHGVLRRLAVTGDVRDDVEVKGKTAYRFVTQLERALAEMNESVFSRVSKAVQPAGGVPNPHGRNLGEMLTPEKKK